MDPKVQRRIAAEFTPINPERPTRGGKGEIKRVVLKGRFGKAGLVFR